jgi:hypothetical protein
MADLEFRPYMLPMEDIKKALEPIIPPKPWEPKVLQQATLIVPVFVFRDLGDGFMDVYDDSGTIVKVSKQALTKPFFKQTDEFIMKAMKDAVLAVAKRLAKGNNTVTTLEIKTELRRDYPYYFWTQQVVSDFMSQFAGDGIFTYTDNGTFRTYSVASASQVAQTAGPVSKQVTKTLATAPKRGRGRPRKNQNTAFVQTTINRSLAHSYAGDPNFESFDFGGKVITRAYIRAQKKSPLGYLSKNKLNKLDAITVNGKTYQVK